ncbi:MAG TPA: tetratricopeptide repeat protein [Edaphobacter sp.]|jgi:tetratricopeptide (TPR) repeat protein|nr:tetratricopeptide repeat protein [Edaphobacter sp.]
MRGHRFHRQARNIGRARRRAQTKRFLREWVKGLTFARVSFILLGLPLTYYVYREVTRDVLIIDPITVPKRFEEAGLTPQVMANRLGDRLQEIERSTQTSMKKDVMGALGEETTIPEVEIPGTKLGLKTVVDIARSVFGRHTKHIGGDVVFPVKSAATGIESSSIKNPVNLTVYFVQERVGSQSLNETVDGDDIAGLVQKLAELALRQVNPYVLAAYYEDRKQISLAESTAEAMTRDASQDTLHKTAAFDLWCIALGDEGKYDEAIAKCIKAIELDPRDKYAYGNWGLALDAEGKHQEAIAKWTKAIELDPRDSFAYGPLGDAFLSQGRHEEAAAMYAKVIKLDPKDSTAYDHWGIALRYEGKYEEANAKFAKAIEINPENKFAYDNWGLALDADGKHQEAITKYAKAIEIDSQYVIAYIDWGTTLRLTGKPEDAIAKYAKAIEIDPKNKSAYGDWGFALDDEGKYEEAITKYAKVIELDPKDVLAYNSWAMSLQKLGRRQEASEKFAAAQKAATAH